MAKKNNKPSDKVDDVSKPGETPASSNARPTITGHSPTIKNDPMVAFSSRSESEEEIQKSDKKDSYVTRSKTKINPISEDLKAEEKDENKDSEEEQTEDKADKDAGTDKEKQVDKPDEKSASVGSESAAIDAIAQTADAKKAESKQEEEDKKHQEYIDGLIKSGKYRLPIIEGGHKGSAERFVSWIFLLLLIASIGVYLAIDAGYIQIGFDLPFEFIKN